MSKERLCLVLSIGVSVLLCVFLLGSCSRNKQQKKDQHTVYNSDTAAIAKTIRTIPRIEYHYPDSSIKLLRQAYTKSIDLGYLQGAEGICSEIANVYVMMSRYKECYEYCIKSLQYPPFNRYELANALCNMGIVNVYWGKYDEALLCYKKAMTVGEKNDKDNIVDHTCSNLTVLLLNMHRYREAMYYMNKLEQEARKKTSKLLLAECLVNQIGMYTDMKLYDSAIARGAECIQLCKKYSSQSDAYKDILCVANINMGQVYQDKRDMHTALFYFDEAKEGINTARPDIQMSYYMASGNSLMQAGKNKKAIIDLKNSLQLAKKMDIKDVLQTTWLLANTYSQDKDYKKAMETYADYIALKDTLQNADVLKKVNEYEVKFRTSEKDKDLLEEQIALSHQKDLVKEKNFWIITISGGFFVILIFIVSLYRIAVHKRRTQAKNMEILKQQSIINQLQASIAGEDKERKRIGRELHDGISGQLTAINMNVVAIQNQHTDIAAMSKLDSIVALLQSTGAEVRKMAHNLIPDHLQEHDLPEILGAFVASINNGGDLKINTVCYGDFNDLDKAFTMLLYRMIQELVHNIVKHAMANNATIQVRRYSNTLSVTVEDDGAGFNKDEVKKGLGLSHITARVEAMQGYISIGSQPGHGTTVYMEFDLEKTKSFFA